MLYKLDLSKCKRLPWHFKKGDPKEIILTEGPSKGRWIIPIEYNDPEFYIRVKESVLAPFIRVSEDYRRLMTRPLTFHEKNLPEGATIEPLSILETANAH